MRIVSLLMAVLLAAATHAEEPGALFPLDVRAHSVDVSPGTLDGLFLRGTVSLNAGHDEFGGFSGLLIRQGRLVAVTDRGWWLEADLEDSPTGLRPAVALFGPMRGEDGETFDKSGGDAEALTGRGDKIVIGFEHDHRLMVHLGQGQLGGTIRDRAFEQLSTNKGIEMLATLPDGRLLATEERPRGGHHRMFLVHGAGNVGMRLFPESGDFNVTGGDVGPDGRLYLLLRDYGQFTGVSIRVHRYDLGEDGFPVIASRREIAAFESESGIDNMEGLAVWLDGAGRTRLTLISDDNFNLIQRTLLMDFEITDPGA